MRLSRGAVFASINPGSTADKRIVSVGYKLNFSAAEAGKKYKITINLFGEESANDDEPPTGLQFGPAKPIYTFPFALFPYTTVTAQAGEQSFTETREVTKDKLNEDPGVEYKEVAPQTVLKFPHDDEIFARVTAALEATARSATLELAGFVLG